MGGQVGGFHLAAGEGRVDLFILNKIDQFDIQVVFFKQTLLFGDPPGAVTDPRLGADANFGGAVLGGRGGAAGQQAERQQTD